MKAVSTFRVVEGGGRITNRLNVRINFLSSLHIDRQGLGGQIPHQSENATCDCGLIRLHPNGKVFGFNSRAVDKKAKVAEGTFPAERLRQMASTYSSPR